MTLTAIGGSVLWPEPHAINTSTAVNLGSATAKVAGTYIAPVTGSLDKISFRTTGAASGSTWRVSVQTVTASTGIPTGTLWDTGTDVLVANPTANTFYEVTLGTSASLTAGDVFAIVIDVNTYSATGTVTRFANILNAGGVPFASTATTGAYTAAQFNPNYGFKIGGTWQPHPGNTPGALLVSTNVTTASTEEAGNKFAMPFGARAIGAWIGNCNAGFVATLYDDSTNVLSSQTFDYSGAAGTSDIGVVLFDSPQTLTDGTTYRLAVEASSASSLSLRGWDFTSGYETAMPGGTSITHGLSRLGNGAWTETATRRYAMGLILDQFDVGGSGTYKVKTGGAFVDVG